MSTSTVSRFCLLLVAFVALANANRKGDKLSESINGLLDGYDKNVRPNYGGPSSVVGVTVFVLSVRDWNDSDMSFTMELYFRQFWQDPRLAYTRTSNVSKIVLTNSDLINKIWQPDTFFVNEIESSVSQMMKSNEFLRILPNGEILLSKRINVKASCPMDFHNFPWDIQTCYLEIESFGFTMEDIRYKWNDGGDNSIMMSSDVSVAERKIFGSRAKTIEARLSTGNYSRLTMEIGAARFGGYYLFTVFLPCIFLVILAFLANLVSEEQFAARIGVVSLAAIGAIGLMVWNNSNLPKVSFIKAMDVFTLSTVVFILIILLGVTVLPLLARDDKIKAFVNKGFTMGFLLVYIIFLIAYFASQGEAIPEGFF